LRGIIIINFFVKRVSFVIVILPLHQLNKPWRNDKSFKLSEMKQSIKNLGGRKLIFLQSRHIFYF